MKKKVILIVLVIILVGGSFFLGRQVGINTNAGKTKTVTKNETVSKRDIKKTLTGSGEISAKTIENLTLTTTNYFKAMCTEDDDTVKKGENLLEYTDGSHLVAPYDLVVNSHSVPNTENICDSSNYVQVSNLETLNVNISVSENEINNIKLGQEVEITLTADDTKVYTGKVTKVNSIGSYDTSGTTYTITVEFENDGNVKLGMSTSCTITISEKTDVLCVPIDGVYQNKSGKDYVEKLTSKGSTKETVVELGIADDNYVEIMSGLSEGDKVQISTEITQSSQKSSDSKGFGENGMPGGGGDMPGGGDGMPGGDMPGGGGTPPNERGDKAQGGGQKGE